MTIARPVKPKPPARGLRYSAVPDPDWRVAPDGMQCRYVRAGVRCDDTGAVERFHPNDPVSQWRAYCPSHSHGRWAEDGMVLQWALRNLDGAPVPEGEASRIKSLQASSRGDLCGKHDCPRRECPPDSVHNHSFRFRTDLWDRVVNAAETERTDASDWVRRAIEAALAEEKVPVPDVAAAVADLKAEVEQIRERLAPSVTPGPVPFRPAPADSAGSRM